MPSVLKTGMLLSDISFYIYEDNQFFVETARLALVGNLSFLGQFAIVATKTGNQKPSHIFVSTIDVSENSVAVWCSQRVPQRTGNFGPYVYIQCIFCTVRRNVIWDMDQFPEG